MAPVPHIPLEPIASSSLKAIGYDPAAGTLAVQFQNESIFHYADVPIEVALELGAAPSKGTFYAQRIKQHFKGRRVTGPCKMCGREGVIGEACACGKGQHAEQAKATNVICPDCHGSGSRADMRCCRTCGGGGVVRAK